MLPQGLWTTEPFFFLLSSFFLCLPKCIMLTNNHPKKQVLFLGLFLKCNFILTGLFCKSPWVRCHLSPILSLHSPCSAWVTVWSLHPGSTMTSSVMKAVHSSSLYPCHECKYSIRYQLQLPTLSLSFTEWETLTHQIKLKEDKVIEAKLFININMAAESGASHWGGTPSPNMYKPLCPSPARGVPFPFFTGWVLRNFYSFWPPSALKPATPSLSPFSPS